jgi:hypothetical protein
VNPAPPKPGELKIEPRKLILASAVEAVFIVAGVVAYVMTENTPLFVALVVVGSMPVLWVVFSAMLRKPRPPGQAAIVEGGRGPRR